MKEIPNGNDDRIRYLTYEQMNLINAFRAINLNSAIYSKFMLDCTVRNSPCFEVAYSRLLLVPYEAFRIFANYYSEEDASMLYNLMMQDIILMKRLSDALIARDEEAATAIMQQWTQNIDALADFYASINAYWTKEQWSSLLTRNMQLTYQEILAHIMDDCTRAFDVFDRLKSQATLIGDYQARGIMRSLMPLPDMANQGAGSF